MRYTIILVLGPVFIMLSPKWSNLVNYVTRLLEDMANKHHHGRNKGLSNVTEWVGLTLLYLLCIQLMAVVESFSMNILSACSSCLAHVMPVQAVLSSASGTECSKRKESSTASSLPSESRMTNPALPLVPRTLPSKFTLTNPIGGGF